MPSARYEPTNGLELDRTREHENEKSQITRGIRTKKPFMALLHEPTRGAEVAKATSKDD